MDLIQIQEKITNQTQISRSENAELEFRKKNKNFANETVAQLFLNSKVLEKNDEDLLAFYLLRECITLDPFNPIILDTLQKNYSKRNDIINEKVIAEVNYKYNFSFHRTFNLAIAEYKNQNDEVALQYFFECLSVVIEDNEVLFEIYKTMGNIFVKMKDFDSAEEYYYKANNINSESDTLLVNIGILEFQKKDLEKCVYCFRNAVKINNQNDKAWVGLSMVHMEYGDLDLSWGNLTKALDINPINKTALTLMSQLLNTSEKKDICKTYSMKYLEIENFDEDISMLLIHILTDLGDYHAAHLESLKTYIWNPDNKKNEKLYLELSKLINREV